MRVYWLCAKGHDWPAAIASRSTGPKAGCPECSGSSSSKPEVVVRKLLSSSSIMNVQSHRPVRLHVPWSGKTLIVADIVGTVQGLRTVVEYDGAYFHGTHRPEVWANDMAKTLALLDAGYLVVRLRENKLPPLDIVHPRLFQMNFPHTLREARAQKQLTPVLDWLQGTSTDGEA